MAYSECAKLFEQFKVCFVQVEYFKEKQSVHSLPAVVSVYVGSHQQKRSSVSQALVISAEVGYYSQIAAVSTVKGATKAESLTFADSAHSVAVPATSLGEHIQCQTRNESRKYGTPVRFLYASIVQHF